MNEPFDTTRRKVDDEPSIVAVIVALCAAAMTCGGIAWFAIELVKYVAVR